MSENADWTHKNSHEDLDPHTPSRELVSRRTVVKSCVLWLLDPTNLIPMKISCAVFVLHNSHVKVSQTCPVG
jgi:hypothetical protein